MGIMMSLNGKLITNARAETVVDHTMFRFGFSESRYVIASTGAFMNMMLIIERIISVLQMNRCFLPAYLRLWMAKSALLF